MKIISLNINNKQYSVKVSNQIINEIDHFIAFDNVVIITQKNIFKLYEKYFNKTKKIIFIDETEKAKSIDVYTSVIKKIIKYKCNRKSTIIALGGGVVGDLAGFVASTYMRGINYIQIPTTLLSMVDSSIGGKTGINLDEGKNLIGSFYQPKLVLIDPNFIKTLNQEEIISGLGEVIKYGILSNIDFLKHINSILFDIIKNRDLLLLEKIIIDCVKIKINIVERDEKEQNLRQILNFGHSIGHAIENQLGYNSIKHGISVCYGIISALILSKQKYNFPQSEYDLILNCMKKLDLSILREINIKSILEILKKDKKNNNNYNFVLLKKIGFPTTNNELNEAQIIESIQKNEYISN